MVTATQTVALPSGSRLLTQQCQHSAPNLWFFSDSELMRVEVVGGGLGLLAAHPVQGESLEGATLVCSRGDWLALHNADNATLTFLDLRAEHPPRRLTPVSASFPISGTSLIGVFEEADARRPPTLSLWTMEGPPQCVGQSPILRDAELDSPTDARLLQLSGGELVLLVVCYGYCLLVDCTVDGDRYEVRTGKVTRVSEGLVYDPIYLCDVWDTKVLLSHGYGSGIASMDVATGALTHCPLPSGERYDYGLFHDAVLSPNPAAALVHTKHGAYRWDLGSCLESLSSEYRNVVTAIDAGWVLRSEAGVSLLPAARGSVAP